MSIIPKLVTLGGKFHGVFDVHAIGEFNQTQFYVARLCQITGSGYYAFQPRKIGKRSTASLSDNFQTCFVEVSHEPKLIDALAIGGWPQPLVRQSINIKSIYSTGTAERLYSDLEKPPAS